MDGIGENAGYNACADFWYLGQIKPSFSEKDGREYSIFAEIEMLIWFLNDAKKEKGYIL